MFYKVNAQFTESQINSFGIFGITNKGKGFQEFIESELLEQLNINLKHFS